MTARLISASRSDRAALRALRRRAGRGRSVADRPAVRGDRARRGDLRTWRRRLEGEHPRPRWCASCRGWGGPRSGSSCSSRVRKKSSSLLEDGYPAANPEAFRADAILVADGGSIRAGAAVSDRLTARRRPHHRRGADACEQQALGPVRWRCPRRARRARPCARRRSGTGTAMSRWRGFAARSGRASPTPRTSSGSSPRSRTTCRSSAAGGIGSKIWSGPGDHGAGIDCPAVDGAPASVQSHARAVLNVRSIRSSRPRRRRRSSCATRGERPFGVPLELTAGAIGDGYRATSSGPAWDAMIAAMSTAWGAEPSRSQLGAQFPSSRR